MRKRKITGNPLKEFYTRTTQEVNKNGIDSENFERKLTYALNSYHSQYETKDAKKFLLEYFKKDKELKDKISSMDDNTVFRFQTFAFNLKFVLESGVPIDITPENKEYFDKKVAEINQLEKRKNDKIHSKIQDALLEKAKEFSPKIDEYIDEYIENDVIQNFDVVEYLVNSGLSKLHVKKLIEKYSDEKQEYLDINSDPFLKEAYSHLKPKQIKKIIEFYDSKILNELNKTVEQITETVKKERKPRAKKVVETKPKIKKEKVPSLSNVKILLESKLYKITSEKPEKLIGAKNCLVFNEKQKKITLLSSEKGFDIKGTTIQNISVSKCKSLRNPAMFLNDLKNTTKKDIEKVWKTIYSTETDGTGRLSETTMIINIF